MDFLRYLPTYLPDLSEDLADLVRSSSSDLADLEGPPQAVLTREQSKSLENKFLAYLDVPYPAEFFLKKGHFILSKGEKKKINNFLLVDYHIG